MPVGDQITTKVHNYVKSIAKDIQAELKKKGYGITEIALYDIMAKELQEKFLSVDWNNSQSEKAFVEFIINSLEELRGSKDVKVRYRKIPKAKK